MKTKKLKKKNFTLFIISLIIISIGIFNGINLVNNKSNKESKQVINKTSSKKKKLEKLNNINKKISYFNEEYLDRYIAYKEKNKDLNDKQIIKNVNMNLDKKFYENKKEAINQNTELFKRRFYSRKLTIY